MADILHRVGIEGPTPEKVYDALTTLNGLSGWWIHQHPVGPAPRRRVDDRLVQARGMA
jgi:uncharacterized protein YndB with AHSA1/START domain